MTRAFPEATVTGLEPIMDSIPSLPDEVDRHAVAAAISAKADIIVTDNLKDFPNDLLATYGIEAKSSDAFIADAIDLNPALAIAAIRKMRLRFQRPEKTPEVLLRDMEKIGLTQATDQLEEHVELL